MTFAATAPVIDGLAEVLSPGLVLVTEVLDANLRQMIAIAGDVRRLRPHCKTHKMAEVTRRELALGITKHKCATFAEAEMLADAGVPDIFLAYNLVGPNVNRAVAFLKRYPQIRFAVTADDGEAVEQLSAAVTAGVSDTSLATPAAPPTAVPAPSVAGGTTIGIYLDLDTGQHRTGLADPQRLWDLAQRVCHLPGLRLDGFHLYDGHNHQTDLAERTAAVLRGWEFARALRDQFQQQRLTVPAIICGGTGSFPVFAGLTDPAIELSPGTCVFHDASYGATFPDLPFQPALWLLTRVISRPTADRVTLDLGNKAVAADPPKGQRVWIPALPDAVQVIHNEEHLVLETPQADRFRPGDVVWAVPKHVCPTSALHRSVSVATGGKIVGEWAVTARDRRLTI